MKTVFAIKLSHLRDADLKDVVLDQLFPQHDDAELNAQFDQAASWSTLRETHFIRTLSHRHCMFDLFRQIEKIIQMRSWMTNLFHSIIIKDVDVIARSTSKPAKTTNSNEISHEFKIIGSSIAMVSMQGMLKAKCMIL